MYGRAGGRGVNAEVQTFCPTSPPPALLLNTSTAAAAQQHTVVVCYRAPSTGQPQVGYTEMLLARNGLKGFIVTFV